MTIQAKPAYSEKENCFDYYEEWVLYTAFLQLTYFVSSISTLGTYPWALQQYQPGAWYYYTIVQHSTKDEIWLDSFLTRGCEHGLVRDDRLVTITQCLACITALHNMYDVDWAIITIHVHTLLIKLAIHHVCTCPLCVPDKSNRRVYVYVL